MNQLPIQDTEEQVSTKSVLSRSSGHSGQDRRPRARVILSFDVEEHYRIEAASGLLIPDRLKSHYQARVQPITQWILDVLAEHNIRATFFVVGELARDNPRVVRAIHAAGHEVASHSWDHRRVYLHTPDSFREDLRKCKDTLAQLTGEPVWGYRAPTFSIGRRNSWAIDVLAESGFLYDSSIFPVRHDRYGDPDAPRGPFLFQRNGLRLIELPPATLRVLGYNLPVAGGGYFRLFPTWFMTEGIRQLRSSGVAMLYFHPWEFDTKQQQLQLPLVNRMRTYVGTSRTKSRLRSILPVYTFGRAIEVARDAVSEDLKLQRFAI